MKRLRRSRPPACASRAVASDERRAYPEVAADHAMGSLLDPRGAFLLLRMDFRVRFPRGLIGLFRQSFKTGRGRSIFTAGQRDGPPQSADRYMFYTIKNTAEQEDSCDFSPGPILYIFRNIRPGLRNLRSSPTAERQ